MGIASEQTLISSGLKALRLKISEVGSMLKPLTREPEPLIGSVGLGTARNKGHTLPKHDLQTRSLTQRLQYPLIKECSLNRSRDPTII